MRGLLDEIERFVEAFASAEERIRHVLDAEMRSIVEDELDLGFGFARSPAPGLRQIGGIHDEEQVEALKVARLNLPRALPGNVHAPLERGGAGALVRRLADMPIAEPGRVDLEQMREALFLNHPAKDALGHRRAADIAEADEEDAVVGHAAALHGPRRRTRTALLRSWLAAPVVASYVLVVDCLPSEVAGMPAWNDASELRREALGQGSYRQAFAGREKQVGRDLWTNLKGFAGKVPFAQDLVAGYYCALDPKTPTRVRGMLLATVAYFILPFDFVPDLILGLGFADDAALVTAVLALVSAHITPTHRAAAARALDTELPKRT